MDNNFLIPMGKRISELRRSNGMTQEALANKLGVTPKHISHTECGTSALSLKNLVELCQLFDCSLDYIVRGKKEDSVLSKLPTDFTSILYSGTKQDIERLNRYLDIYLELTNTQE